MDKKKPIGLAGGLLIGAAISALLFGRSMWNSQSGIREIRMVKAQHGAPDKMLGVACSESLPAGVGPWKDSSTGITYDCRWLYYLPSKDPRNPSKRIVFWEKGRLKGIAVFRDPADTGGEAKTEVEWIRK